MTKTLYRKSWHVFKHRGFTDYLYFLNLILSWLFIIVCIVITIFSGKLGITDLSLISVGLPAVFAELGIHTGFIVWKAKTENISKYGYDPDNAHEITNVMGFQVDPEEEEDTNDNNAVYNDVDIRGRYDSSFDRSNQESLHKFRERVLGKRHSPN